MGQDVTVPPLFHAEGENNPLDNLDPELQGLSQFPEGQDHIPDFFVSPPPSDWAAHTASGTSYTAFGAPTDEDVAYQPPSVEHAFNGNVFPAPNDQGLPSRRGSVMAKCAPLRSPQTPYSFPNDTWHALRAGPWRERNRPWRSVDNSPTVPRHDPEFITTRGSAGGPATFPAGEAGGMVPGFEPDGLDHRLIKKKEGASAALRIAAGKKCKRERKFFCEECGDSLTSQQNLKSGSYTLSLCLLLILDEDHMNTHFQVNPYRCDHEHADGRPKYYRHSRSLNRHLKKEHNILPDRKRKKDE